MPDGQDIIGGIIGSIGNIPQFDNCIAKPKKADCLTCCYEKYPYYGQPLGSGVQTLYNQCVRDCDTFFGPQGLTVPWNAPGLVTDSCESDCNNCGPQPISATGPGQLPQVSLPNPISCVKCVMCRAGQNTVKVGINVLLGVVVALGIYAVVKR